MEKFLIWIEKVGNKLPHPFWIFVYLAVFVILCSLVCGILGVSVTHPITQETVQAENLLSQYGIQRFVLEMVTNFSHFAPLGLVLVMLCGVSLAPFLFSFLSPVSHYNRLRFSRWWMG